MTSEIRISHLEKKTIKKLVSLAKKEQKKIDRLRLLKSEMTLFFPSRMQDRSFYFDIASKINFHVVQKGKITKAIRERGVSEHRKEEVFAGTI